MLALKIISVLAVLILLLCLTRVGAKAVFREGTVTVDARFGIIRFRAYPRPPKKEKAEKTEKQLQKEEQAKAAKTAKKAQKEAEKAAKPKPDLKKIAALVRSAVQELLPPLKRSLARIGRGIRIKPLELYVKLGAANDPAAGAQLYGEVNAAVWAVMPVLEQFIDIPDPYIQTDLDFDAEKTALQGEAGISIRIGTLLAAAIGIGIPALRWFLRLRKQQKNENTQPPAASAAAGETLE